MRIAWLAIAAVLGLGARAAATPAVPAAPTAAAAAPALPDRLADTGFRADAPTFTPHYPLWSDGTSKRRWLALPPGTDVDRRDPDAWQFPPGTRLWKEFALGGRPVETRFVERLADGSWRFASYVWNADGSEARLAPAAGVVLPLAAASGGRYQVPSRSDCLACHGSAPVPVLGLSALQLAPRIAAADELERAALGYLHANCGHCHNTSENRVPLRLTLAQSAADPVASRAAVLRSLLAAPARHRVRGQDAAHVVAPGAPQASVLVLRMASRDSQLQMPPLGTAQVDAAGLALIERWIRALPPSSSHPEPYR